MNRSMIDLSLFVPPLDLLVEVLALGPCEKKSSVQKFRNTDELVDATPGELNFKGPSGEIETH
jgi:hypothetical protein